MKKLLILFLIPFFFVACDKEEKEDDSPYVGPHLHYLYFWFNSKDGKAEVNYPHDAVWTTVRIPAEGGDFSFIVNDESGYCQYDEDCKLFGQKVDNYKVKLSRYCEAIWKCKVIPINPTSQEMMEYQELTNYVVIANSEDKHIETKFGGFDSEDNGFTIHVCPNEGNKERSYVLFFKPYNGYDNGAAVCIIQACSN